MIFWAIFGLELEKYDLNFGGLESAFSHSTKRAKPEDSNSCWASLSDNFDINEFRFAFESYANRLSGPFPWLASTLEQLGSPTIEVDIAKVYLWKLENVSFDSNNFDDFKLLIASNVSFTDNPNSDEHTRFLTIFEIQTIELNIFFRTFKSIKWNSLSHFDFNFCLTYQIFCRTDAFFKHQILKLQTL